MNKLVKYLIILLISILLVTIIIYIILINKGKNKRHEIEIEENIAEKITITNIEQEQRIYMYIYSNEIMNKMFNYISEKEENVNNEEAILAILDEEYKTKYQLNQDNIMVFLSRYKNINSYFTKEIYTQEINHRQNVEGEYLYIKGIIRKNQTEKNIYILMKQDMKNSTYSITFLDQIDFSNIEKKNNPIEINIERNKYNIIYNKMITDYQLCLEYFNDYLNTINNNPMEGYKLLDEEYKRQRFSDKDNYIEYVNKIKNENSSIVLKEYSIEEKDGTTQYICIDQKGNYYIFKKNNMMNYVLILDPYTIDLPEFLEKYNNATEEKKVLLNIQKVFQAINTKDYQYIYNKLDNTFKQNNFETLEKLEKYIKENLYERNKVTYTSYEGSEEVYIYNIQIKNDDNKQDKIINKKIAMKLKKGTDFVMSFNID